MPVAVGHEAGHGRSAGLHARTSTSFYRVFYRSCAMSPAEYRRHDTPAGAVGVEGEAAAMVGETGAE